MKTEKVVIRSDMFMSNAIKSLGKRNAVWKGSQQQSSDAQGAECVTWERQIEVCMCENLKYQHIPDLGGSGGTADCSFITSISVNFISREYKYICDKF